MRHLYVIDPIESFHIKKDTTFAFMMAAQARGHENWICTLDDISGREGYAAAHVRRVTTRPVVGDHFAVTDERTERLDAFNVIWMRKDPPFNTQYIYVTYLLDLVDPSRTLVMNRPQGLRNANEKAFTLQFPSVIPPTLLSRSPSDIRAFCEEVGGHAVIKPLDLMGGTGIFVLRSDDTNFNSIVDAVTRHRTEFVMVQRYLPDAKLGDKRLLLIDGEIIGALLRVPQGLDFRGNMAAGGIATATEITDRDREIVDVVAPRLRAEGLHFVGLDVIGGYVTEINVTSPTGIVEASRFHDRDLADVVIGWAERNAPSAD